MSRTSTSTATIFLAMAIVLLSSQASPPPSPPAPGPSSSDCMTSLLNMSDCLSYVEMGGNLSKPDKGCCPELAGLVESNPICLCQLLGKSDSFGVQIDLNKALKLPSACNLETSPVSLCSAVGVPVGGPAENEESIAPGGSSASSPGQSRADKSENGGPSTARSIPTLAILLLVAFASKLF